MKNMEAMLQNFWSNTLEKELEKAWAEAEKVIEKVWEACPECVQICIINIQNDENLFDVLIIQNVNI